MGPTAGERQEENNAIPVLTNPTTRSILIAHHNWTTEHNPESERKQLNYPKAHKYTNKYIENLKIRCKNADTLTPQNANSKVGSKLNFWTLFASRNYTHNSQKPNSQKQHTQ